MAAVALGRSAGGEEDDGLGAADAVGTNVAVAREALVYRVLGDVARVLRDSPGLRWMTLAQALSLLGDWANEIAAVNMLDAKTESGFAIGLFFALREGAFLAFQPVGGVLGDAFDRRRVLMGADAGRALVVLLFIIPAIWDNAYQLLYVCVVLQAALSSASAPTFGALMPQFVRKDQVTAAAALNGTVYSSLLMVGAALGGVISFAFGPVVAFLADSASYVASLLCYYRTLRFPLREDAPEPDKTADGGADAGGHGASGGAALADEAEAADALLGAAAQQRSADGDDADDVDVAVPAVPRVVVADASSPSGSSSDSDSGSVSGVKGSSTAISDASGGSDGGGGGGEDDDDGVGGGPSIRLRSSLGIPRPEGALRASNDSTGSSSGGLGGRRSLQASDGSTIVILAEDEVELVEDLPEEKPTTLWAAIASFWKQLLYGIRFLRRRPYFLGLTMMKASGTFIWATGDIALFRYAAPRFADGPKQLPLILALMYGTAGFGIAVVPLVVARLVPKDARSARRVVVAGSYLVAIGTLAMAYDKIPALYLVSIAIRAAGSGCIWIFSNSLLQTQIPNAVKARTMSVQWAALSAAGIVSRLLFGGLYDAWNENAPALQLIWGVAGVCIALGWTLFERRHADRDDLTSASLELSTA